MTVYIVMVYTPDDGFRLGVYSTYDKANAAALNRIALDKAYGNTGNTVEIEEVEVK